MTEPILARPPVAYPPGRFFDEVFAPGGSPRLHARPLAYELGRLGPEQLAAAGRRRDTIFIEQGITFDATGEDGPVRDRPFPLDLVPRILPADGVDDHQARPRPARPGAEPVHRRRLPRARDRA